MQKGRSITPPADIKNTGNPFKIKDSGTPAKESK